MITAIRPVTIHYHTVLLECFDCIPYVYYIPMTYLFCSWKFVPLQKFVTFNPLYLFCPFPHLPPLLTTASLCSASVSLFLFCFVCLFVLFCRFYI